MNPIPSDLDHSPHNPHLLELIQGFKEAETALKNALNAQIDAVIDPVSLIPFLLQEAQVGIHASETRHRGLLSRLAAVVFELKPDGTTLFVNDAVLDMLGYTPEELQGRNWWDVLLLGEQHRQKADLYARFKNGDVTQYELTLTTKKGQVCIIELNSANRTNPDGGLERILGLGIDITQRRKAEDELGKYRAHLEQLISERTSELSEANVALQRLADERQQLLISEQVARLEAESAVQQRDEFLSVAAHELKTPVTSIRGFTEILTRQFTKQGTFDATRLESLLIVINKQAVKLTTLISQLLDVSRIEVGRLALEKVSVDVPGLVNEVVTQIHHKTVNHIIVVHSPEVLTTMLDPLCVEQVLVNLIDNAVKFSPEGGTITVEVSVLDTQTMQIAVTDQGIGIPVERREHIFERFYQAHGSGYLGGMGLGLSISKEIIVLHGGDLRAEFPTEGGTRFVVTLPLSLD